MGMLADGLKEDHDDMRTMAAVLGEMASRLEEGSDVPSDDIREVLTYMDTFVARCHHAKEEQILFPALEESGLKRDGGPLEIMSAEHQLESNFLSGMTEAVRRYGDGDGQSAQAVAQYARDFAMLLVRDMEQEDQLLYPLAEQALPAARQERMVTEFEQIEREVLGPSKHEHYHAMAHELAERYLN